MSHFVLPGCSPPDKNLFRENSTLDVIFKEIDRLTRSASLKSILFVAVIYLITNIFHLIVLTRPSMRSMSVSKEMILIAMSGVLNGIFGAVKNALEVFEHEFACVHSYGYHVLVLFHFVIFQLLNQVVLWEIVYITFLRAAIILDVRHGLKTEKLKSYMRMIIYSVFSVFILNHLFRFMFHRVEQKIREEDIKESLSGNKCIPGVEYAVYGIVSLAGDCLRRIMLSVAGITSLLTPIFIMLILSIFLVFELRISPVATVSSNQKQNSAAHGLLLFLCFYVLAELPYAFLFGIGLYNPADFEVLDEYIYTQVDIFIYVNMCLGILVYCLMSSQYRKTVVDTFWRRKKVAVVDQSSRATS